MKRLLFFIVFQITILGCIYAQNYNKGVLDVLVEDGNLKSIGKNNTNNNQLNNLFTKFHVIEFKQLVPFAKTPELHELYQIQFDNGKIDSLKKKLENTHLFRFVKKLPIPVPTYEPTDYMWYLTTQDPDNWLWHLKKIHADQAWDITKGDSSVKIAVIDTWFDINHPDLSQKIVPYYDPYDGTPFNSDCYYNNHGTTVASFAAAQTDGGGQLASVGFNSRIIAYTFDNGLAKALHASTVMGADVISISWGTYAPFYGREMDSLMIEEILNNGTAIVVAAGNGWNGPHNAKNDSLTYFYPFSPEYDSRIIIVTSTDKNDNHTFIENGIDYTHSHFPEVDICAPGYDVMGAKCTLEKDPTTGNCVNNPWPYYGSFSGTSFATPIVAGVCALMKSVNHSLTPWAIQDIIKKTADPVNDADLYPGLVGAGRINAYKALKVADCDFTGLPSPIITGNDFVCEAEGTSFTLVNRLPGCTVEWLHSNNTIQIGGQTTENYIVKSAVDYSPDSGCVKVVMHTAGCGNDTIEKTFWVGGIPIVDSIRLITNSYTIGPNSTIEVLGISPGAENYNWTVGGGTITSGQGTSDIVIQTASGVPVCPVDLTIQLTTSNSCGNSQTFMKSFPFDCSGGPNPLSVSPNPVSQTLNVEVNDTTSAAISQTVNEAFTVQLFDPYNKVVFQKRETLRHFSINVSRYKPGVYYLRVIKGNKVYAKKVIIATY